MDEGGLALQAYGFKEWKHDEGKKFQTGWQYHQGLATRFFARGRDSRSWFDEVRVRSW